MGFPGSSAGKESACNAGDPSSIPGSGRSAGEGINYPLQYSWASLVAQLVKNLPAMWEMWVWSLGWEDPLEKETASHSSTLDWRIPWTVLWIGESHGLYSSWGCKELDMTKWRSLSHTHIHICIYIYTHTHICITESLCCVHETLLKNYTSIKKKKELWGVWWAAVHPQYPSHNRYFL